MVKYDQYIGFINSVVTNTIRNGLEFRKFWLILSFKMIFEDYRPKNMISEGNVDIGAEWKEICDTNIYNSALSAEDVSEMVNIIDKKLEYHYRKSSFDEALTELVNKIGVFVDAMQEKFANIDIESAVADMKELSDTIKLNNLDKAAVSEVLAKHAIKDKVMQDGEAN